MADKDLQEKVYMYRLLEARLDGLLKQRDLVLNKISEIQSTIITLDEVEKKPETILIPLGSEAYAHGNVIAEKIIVEIGAGVALEKTLPDAKVILNNRKSELNSAFADLQKEVMRTSQMMQRLGPEIESMMKDSKAE